MSRVRRILMVGGTLACALGIGFFMQRTASAEKPPLATLKPAKVKQSSLLSVSRGSEVQLASMDIEDITLTSAQPEEAVQKSLANPLLQQADFDQNYAADIAPLRTPSDPEMPQLGCDVSATATAAAVATVLLRVTAPCYGNERVTVHHNGLMFTEVTDAKGKLSVQIPALAEDAVFIAAFSNGKGAVARLQVPTLTEFDRVVLQWSDSSGFQLHAREFGASYGEKGHVWSGLKRSVAAAERSQTGFAVRLGDSSTLAPQMAEVYSYPAHLAGRTGTIALTVEAEVTNANCGRDVSAQALELRAGGKLKTQDIVLSVPECSAVGDFLVLNNLVDDLKIAAN